MPTLLPLLLIAILFLFHAAVILLVIGPLLILQPTRRKPEWYARFTTILEPKDAGLPQEHLMLTTPDGVALDCWLVKRPRDARGTILYLHGVGDCKIAGITLARFFFDRGYNVFLYDQRRHGESGGTYCTYGYYEKHDVRAVIDHLQQRNDLTVGPVGVYGSSMGAAVALQAAAIEPRIRAVIAEASFTTLREIIVDYQRRLIKLPWHFLRNMAMARTQQVANFKGRDVAPIDAVRSMRTPVLFIHGTEDELIRSSYSKELYEAAQEPKGLLLVEGADHNDVWDVGGKRYQDVIADFFSTHLSPSAAKD